uniref:Sulfide:quinone oxidoreductase, mitochondrial n=1 Tax=Schistosoma japonicum TaxID=6182 RepID=C1L6T6_SCHJA|nr:hypotherical protein [Schistosoma japonicum]
MVFRLEIFYKLFQFTHLSNDNMEVFSRPTLFTRVFALSIRHANSANLQRKHKIVIVGGGSGGCSMASRLCNHFGEGEVAVIEPRSTHYYQPLWTLVGAGIKTVAESARPLAKVLTPKAKLYSDEITHIEPKESYVVLSNGDKISYEYLILSLGMTLRYDKVAGAEEALKNDPRVCSNYSTDYVEKTYKAYQNFKGGNAVFTLPAGPIKCAGAPQKVMYLFEDYLKRSGKNISAAIHYFTATNKMFSVDKYSNVLSDICKERNINCNLLYNLIEVNSKTSEAVFQHMETKELKRIKYDFLHITPPMCCPEILTKTPNLTNPKACDYVDVNTKTLRHNYYDNIFALGDCAALPTSKTAAAVSAQAATVEKNICDLINGGKGNVSEYDGYTSCPLVTGYNRGIIAEFDYTAQPLETFPFDQGKERYIFYFIKAHILPPLYWDGLLKGLWSGPKTIRDLFN